jgi:hypothetical protein
MEVWASEQDFLRFREERLVPALIKVMGPERVAEEWPPPGFEAMELHNLLQAE